MPRSCRIQAVPALSSARLGSARCAWLPASAGLGPRLDYDDRVTTNGLPPRAVPRLDQLLPPSKPRRILFFSKRKRHTQVASHLIRGFRSQGHRVLWLRTSRLRRVLGRELGEALVSRRGTAFRPDLILVYKHEVSPELLSSLPSAPPRVIYYEDLPADPSQPGERLLEVARRSSLLFTTAGGMIPIFERLGVPRAAYLRGGCDPLEHTRGRPRRALEGEAAFIGKAIGEERVKLMHAVASRFDLKLYGEGWKGTQGLAPTRTHVYPKQYRDICASSRIVLGVDASHDVYLYFSNRTWLTLGCGGFLLTRYIPGLEEFFTNHEHLVWFRSTPEALELIDHYLRRDTERERIARSGFDYVHTYHTFGHATAEIIGTAFGEPWHSAQ